MEKLELKHLAPYLPYGLKIAHFDNQFINGFNIHTLIGLTENLRYKEEDLLTIKRITFWFEKGFGLNNIAHNIKPIIRPLSDLTKEIEHDGEKFVPVEKLRWVTDTSKTYNWNVIDQSAVKYLNYEVVQKLLEWHFDVEGLIEKGLAVDVNTLSE